MSAKIYIEGGGNSKQMRTLCRKGFRKLFDQCNLSGTMPQLIACGSRNEAYDDFKSAVASNSNADFTAMLIDSEEPLTSIEETWSHLLSRDGWEKPENTMDNQVLFMATCMETWIVADRVALSKHYGQQLQSGPLPPLLQLENRTRVEVQDALKLATKNCLNSYAKGKRSFEVVAMLSPATLKDYLPSFERILRILSEKC